MWAVFIVVCLMAVPSVAKKDCQRKCGDVDIPYPFGLTSECYLEESFKLSCNETSTPPQLLLNNGRRILNISWDGEMRVLFQVASNCYISNTSLETKDMVVELKQGYRLSHTENKFVAIGCRTEASVQYDEYTTRTCSSSYVPAYKGMVDEDGSCSGNGCCEISLPHHPSSLFVQLTNTGNDSECLSLNPCTYGFFVEKNWYNFSKSDLSNFTQKMEYRDSWNYNTPVTVDWFVKSNINCSDLENDDGYACGNNTACSDIDFSNYFYKSNDSGYRCQCNQGYQGNPYEADGCQDIDECTLNSCVGTCSNAEGSYTCECPFGQRGDGKTDGSGCKVDTVLLSLGICLCFLCLALGTSWMGWIFHKRKLEKLKKKFFHQNGGLLLQQKLSSQNPPVETAKIFTSGELKAATNNYHESRVLGRGGYGIVYKGFLSDGRIVAIKKSRTVDTQQTEQFINEVIILSQVNHRNVVKLLGCCLETENPLLVYEFISNGTLSHHITDGECKSSISWTNRLRMAAETAGALAYLHSSASQPVIHRDVKSANILLDQHYTAKVADFGASRLIALDQTQLTTLVQGTMGYLDPEYMHTSLLTAKSDVYSFGVVLVELLTGRKVLCFDKPEEERNLAMYFVSSLKEDRLFEVLEHRVASEGSSDQLRQVANLASRCLRLHGQERPTMKEVAMELEGMRVSEKHAWIEQNVEDNAYSVGYQYGNSGYDSISNELTHSLHIGR